MATERLTISLAPELRKWINCRIEAGKYTSVSDYVSTLIRSDRQRDQLDQLLLDGLNSGAPIEVDQSYWNCKKAGLQKQFADR